MSTLFEDVVGLLLGSLCAEGLAAVNWQHDKFGADWDSEDTEDTEAREAHALFHHGKGAEVDAESSEGKSGGHQNGNNQDQEEGVFLAVLDFCGVRHDVPFVK